MSRLVHVKTFDAWRLASEASAIKAQSFIELFPNSCCKAAISQKVSRVFLLFVLLSTNLQIIGDGTGGKVRSLYLK